MSGRASATVVGQGVSGLTTALSLQEAGLDVTIVTAEPFDSTASTAAAAIWHPFFQAPDEEYLRRAMVTYERFTEMADVEGTGVKVRDLTEVFRTSAEPAWWMRALGAGRGPCRVDAPTGYAGAHRVAVPVAEPGRYLRHLSTLFAAGGGEVRRGHVADLAAEASRADVVVNCGGYGGAMLAKDSGTWLVRGVVLSCPKPVPDIGCWIDDSDPYRPTYVIERETDLVLGGFAHPGLSSTEVDVSDVQDVLDRCAALVPAVQGARPVGVRVAFRPVRHEVRVEHDLSIGRVVHNYGHGGSGFTLSWGCARDAVDLALRSLDTIGSATGPSRPTTTER